MLKLLRKRPLLSALLLVLLLFGLVYLAYGHYLGHIVKSVTVSAFESYKAVENNPYLDIISGEDYNKMNFRSRMNFEIPNSYDRIVMKRPFVIHWFTGANVWINHDYYFYDGEYWSTCLTGMDNRFTLKLQNGQCRITDLKLGTSLTGA